MLELSDRVALDIQDLFQSGRLDTDQPLVRIDFRQEAAKAPFWFDMVKGKLHRARCAAIPRASRQSLYAFWQPGPELLSLACKHCRPAAARPKDMTNETGSDLIYGLLSLVDQFGSVLKERGKEYRNSRRGRQLSKDLGKLIGTLGQAERETVSLAVSSLDGLLKTLAQVNQSLERRSPSLNGAVSTNGHGGGRRPRKLSSNGKPHKEV